MKKLLVNYTEYNYWANSRIADFLRDLEPDLADREQNSSFPTLRSSMFHIWDAETLWLERLRGKSLHFWPSKEFTGDFTTGLSSLRDKSADFAAFIAGSDENFLSSELNYSSVDGNRYTSKIYDVVQHCMNHSTFHRGQIVTMLRNVGFTKLSPTDYIAFCRYKQEVNS